MSNGSSRAEINNAGCNDAFKKFFCPLGRLYTTIDSTLYLYLYPDRNYFYDKEVALTHHGYGYAVVPRLYAYLLSLFPLFYVYSRDTMKISNN